MTDLSTTESGWRRFWNSGGFWRAVLAFVAYAVIYQFLPLTWAFFTTGALKDGVFASPWSVLVGLGLAVIVGSIVLYAFAATLGWLPKPLLTKQPVPGRWWMWLAPILVALPILFRLLGIPYSDYSVSVIITTFICGMFVGIAEETIFRGVVVTLLRKGGYGEWVVAALSSLFFALMHSTNIFLGQEVATVAFTLVYTFAFGVLMYLVMRVTGNLIWAIVLHGLTDPTTFLATGGIDVAGAHSNVFLSLTAPVTWLLIIGGFVLLIFIRGRAPATDAGSSQDFPIKDESDAHSPNRPSRLRF